MKRLKIRTKSNRIFTLSDFKLSDDHVSGTDKFKIPIVIRRDDIDSMIEWFGDKD